jgi:phage terminase large subunit
MREPILWFEAPNGEKQVIYELHSKQIECFNHTPLRKPLGEPYPRHIGYGGAAGGGKSHLARAISATAAFMWPGSKGIIFRRTRGEVKENHVNPFRDEVPEKFHGQRIYTYNGEDMCAHFTNNSRIYFGYLKDLDDLRRYRGQEYDYMIFEESTHYEWHLVRWLTGNRLRAGTNESRPFVVYPSNPGDVGHHWYKRLFISQRYYSRYNERPDQYVFVQAFVEDNDTLMERDPGYVDELNTLPEPYRSWYKYGDFEAGLGLALTMLDPDVHFCKPFQIPDTWTLFGAFDWGYSHPFSFGLYAVNEDGRHWKLDTITGRMLQPHEIVDRVNARLEELGIRPGRLAWIAAGHDAWADTKARGENVPTIAESFQGWGYHLVRANISRVAGLNNLRKFLSWEGVWPDGRDDVPFLQFFETEGNRRCFDQLESLPSDPDNPEDALKTNADEFGHGGDDFYDETRYALASRALPARSRYTNETWDPWSKEALEIEHERSRTSHTPKAQQKDVDHPEFGAQV